MTELPPPRVNRRLTARHACHLTVSYRMGKQWHPAMAMDLSPSGCRLRLGEDLPRGTVVSVLFEAPLKDGSRSLAAEVAGTVTWCRLEGLSHQAGVQFGAVPSELQDLLGALG
jgi:hypothetical protein